ncbi:MAG: alpha/beta hydrolase [bacterium]|nr:alpha/beta hydrolase [bacterium]
MKRAIIIHCWSDYPEYCWYPYAKRELEKQGFEVIVPAMPDTDEPMLSKWLPKLREVAGSVNENTYLIGHSAGCITIMRFLELLPDNQRVGGVIFVAGFTDDLGFAELKNFFVVPLNFEKIKSKAKSFIAIASDDDPYVPFDRKDILKERLGAEIIIKHGVKHFSGAADGDAACTELSEVVEAVLRIDNKKP